MQNIASENSPSGEVFNYLFFLFFLCVSYLRGNFFVEILDSIKKGFLSFTYENYFTVAHSSRCSPAKMLIVFWQNTHSKNKVCLWLFSFLSYFLIRLIRRFFFASYLAIFDMVMNSLISVRHYFNRMWFWYLFFYSIHLLIHRNIIFRWLILCVDVKQNSVPKKIQNIFLYVVGT